MRPCRPRRRQHLRVHRRSAQGVDRHDPRARRTPHGRRRGSWSRDAWPSAMATSSPPHCPRSTRSPASACRSARRPTPLGAPKLIPVRRRRCRARPAQPAAAEVGRRRGRTSRSPKAATARAGSARSRRSAGRNAAATSSRSSPRSTQLEAREIVLVAQDLASYGKDRPGELGAGSIVPARRGGRRRTDWVRLLYLYPSDLYRRADRRDLRDRCAVLRPLAAAREQAAAAPDAPVG